MALTLNFVDSYDHYNTSEIGKKWDVAGPSATIDATGTKSRTGTGCLVINSGHGATKVVPANDHFIMSSAFHPNGAIPFGTFFNIMWLVEAVGGNSQVRIVYQPDLSIQARKANDPFSTLLGASAAGLINPSGWNYITAKVFINAAGSVQVRLNGALVIDLPVVNTVAPGTSANANQFQVWGAGGSSDSRHDDTTLWNWTDPADDLTTTPSIYCAVPASDSSPLQWLPNVGLTHFDRVNSIPPDITKFVSDATVGKMDQYLFAVPAPEANPPLPTYFNVLGVQHDFYAETDIAGPRSIAAATNGIGGSAIAISTPWKFYLQPYSLNPSTGLAWQQSELGITKMGPIVAA